MTNSIGSAKCPSVLSSGKYGMSQRHSIVDDSKEYIFVKLTDSAFRAIEEYQRNSQSKRLQNGQCAKIQFIGNSGVIQFPPTDDSSTSNGGGPSDGRKFGFAIDDVEGSLECVQQSGTELDVLGSLSYRVRIHANDDVYDTTRTKMAIAEETEKSKCIREIKPNQTDIGRKVKRAVSAASIHAYTNAITNSSLLNSLNNGNGIGGGSSNSSNVNGSSSYLINSNNNHISSNSSNSNSRNKLPAMSLNQHSPPSCSASGGNSNAGGVNGSRLLSNVSSMRSSPNPSLMGCSGTIGVGNNRYGSPSNLSSSLPTLSSNTSNGGGSYSPTSSGNNHQLGLLNSQQKKSNIVNGRGNGAAAGKGSLGTNVKENGISNGKTHDVSRRKIRERLVHLLALKPFKKPELYARLQNEGLAQRERQLISTILKDISTLSRDNTYNLRRSMWNDVDENWPFFSEQEMQQLKRRKPQNLTPPTSSDASPTSSVHTGSPPPLTNLNGAGGTFGMKRTSLELDFYDGTLTIGTQPKKQRISHYKKDGSSNGGSLTNNSNLGASTRTGIGLGTNSISTSYNQTTRSSSTSYSPHIYNTGNSNGNDENYGNSDLTFNVLNNMDDFIQHTAVIGGDPTFVNRSKTTGNSKISPSSFPSGSKCNNNNVASQMIAKEKRNSGGSNNSSGFGNNRESLSSSNLAMRHKNAKMPYANNFVPENKIVSNPNISTNGSRVTKPHQVQKQRQTSPIYNNSNNHHSHKSTNNISSSTSNNSVIPNIHEDYTASLAPPLSQTTNHNTNSSSSHSRNHLNSSGITSGRSGVESSFLNKHSRPSTPTQKNFNKQHNNSSYKNNLLNNNNNNTPQQLQNNNHNYQTLQQQIDQRQQILVNNSAALSQTGSHSTQQGQQQENSSPTQQIAAAASTFSLTNHSTSSGDAPRYDFSSYTPITSIEQRRKYKTEFESDYDEYRKLLAQIESVGHRFRELADRLSRVQQGCSDYYNIKDQIVSEYNRIRKEEAINRDKQRFDYLHEKLAHIKQLVMDYDKKLTSGLVAPTAAANQQQQHESQNQQQQTTVTNNSAHLSPMLQSSGESNHSPPLIYINPTDTTNNSLSSFTQSIESLKHNQKIHQQHQRQQQEQHNQQHHYPETIQMINYSEEDRYEEETSLQYHHRYDSGDYVGQQHQHITSALENLSHADERNHQHELQQMQQLPPQQPQSYNNNDSDSDTDSTSSSSSDSDDDNSDDSDDENSDDDSNDEDNDDQ